MYVHLYVHVHTCVCMHLCSPHPSSPPADDNDDMVFIALSVAVVLFTLLIVVAVTIMLALCCLHYRRGKTKVTSVDHLASENNTLTTAKPTCLLNTVLQTQLQSNGTKRTECDENA